MLAEVFLFGCRLSEIRALLLSVSPLLRSCCLDEVCFLSSLLGLLGADFIVLDADICRFS
jgi:hypothetical protein